MASWVFWTMYGLIAYTMISLIFIWINWFPIKIHYELWRGRKFITIRKRGGVIVDWDIMLKEGEHGIEKGEKTYKIDEDKGLKFKRLPIHIFEIDNAIELDLTNTTNVYPPENLDPSVYQKIVKRALASGVNDSGYKQYIIFGLIILGIIALASVLALYFGYQNFELIRDFLVNQGVVKI